MSPFAELETLNQGEDICCSFEWRQGVTNIGAKEICIPQHVRLTPCFRKNRGAITPMVMYPEVRRLFPSYRSISRKVSSGEMLQRFLWFNWNLNAGFLDRAHAVASSAIGTVQVDNSGTMFLEHPGTTFHCQTADLSVLYYDNGNPCIADLECQPPPSGGNVNIEFDYPCSCEITGQYRPSGTATIQTYYPGGTTLLCKDEISNIGHGSKSYGFSNTITSEKCGSQFSIKNGDVSNEYVTFAFGKSSIGSTASTTSQDTGCQGVTYSATYSQY